MSEVTNKSHSSLQYALRLLARRGYTEHEIREKLQKKIPDSGEIESVIDKLKKLRCLNDKSFTENYIRFRTQQSPRSLMYLANELQRKGIEKNMVIEAWNSKKMSDENLCQEAAKRKSKSLNRETPQKKREKLIRFLASRGFNWDIIHKVLGQKNICQS